MKIYNEGPNDLPCYEMEQITEDQFEWFVFWYEDGGYDGSGYAVALGQDGLLYCANLGHCSCYGPMESWPDRKMTVEEFLRPKDGVLDYWVKEEVDKRVRSLVE